DHPPGEALALLDELAHALLDPVQVLGPERLGDVEVVIEAVLDRRPDAQPGPGEQVLDGLGEHVGGRVPHDHPAVVAVQGPRLDLVALLDHMAEVPEHPVDPGRDHGPLLVLPLAVEQVPGGRARAHRPLVPIDLDGDAQFGHLCSWSGRDTGRSECYEPPGATATPFPQPRRSLPYPNTRSRVSGCRPSPTCGASPGPRAISPSSTPRQRCAPSTA